MWKARLAAAIVVALSTAASALAASGTPGAPGVGDPFFLKAGNGGYDVKDYFLHLRYRTGVRQLSGAAVISATATQDLSRFDLDLRGFDVTQVKVDRRKATFSRAGQELRITPSHSIPDGRPFKVRVEYAGHPRTVTDPDGSMDGWIYTPDGAWVASEPQGSPSWFPCSDHPSDKARFTLQMTVPHGFRVISNGRLLSASTQGRRSKFLWTEPDPMATYLATATIGHFHVSQSRFDGLHSLVAVDKGIHHAGVLHKIPAIVRFFSRKFGPYPFHDVGAIVDPSPAGYSLEVQTRPLFPGAVDEITLAHELAHQWFGDSVTVETWPDIWLNEGFATWAEWFWGAHTGGPTLRHDFQSAYGTSASNSAYWNPPPADPGGPARLFDGTIYDRGALTLEALRERVGNHDFFRTLRHWTAEYRHANATTQNFIDLAESVSGQDLGQFFDDWLYAPGKPAGYKQRGARVTKASQELYCSGLRLTPRSWNPCAHHQSRYPMGRR